MGGRQAQRAGRVADRRRRFVLVAMAAVVLLPACATVSGAAQDAQALARPELPKPRVDKVRPFTPNKQIRAALQEAKKAEAAATAAAERGARERARPVRWPSSGSATVTLPASGAASAAPGSLPVTLSRPVGKARMQGAAQAAPSAARVEVFDAARAARAGVLGVLLSVTPTAGAGGRTAIGVGYAGFANAYGGDFGGRLGLVRLPACVLTTPEKPECRTRTAVRYRNQRRAERVTAEVSLGAGQSGQPVVLAMTAGTKSGSGDWKATPLSPSATWEAGGSSGSFTWSYPLRVPPSAAGPAPNLAISYDSGSVDGRTASSNNQGTMIGEGFDITSSYVERKYIPCDDDGHDDKQDLCWKYDNALLVLNGKASELVLDDPDGDGKPAKDQPEVWRLKNDDGSKVLHLSGEKDGADNGARDGEYWKVITSDGTEYSFGLDKLPGAGRGDRTQSVWTVPVFGDDKGEPCHGETFAKSDCVQAWRWNLDYVKDTHGNAMSYWYTAEKNKYAKNGKDDEPGTEYVRGGYLTRIQYGQRDGHLFPGPAAQKVEFETAERCLPPAACKNLTYENKNDWPDVPFDAICVGDEPCTGRTGPSFFTRKRLTGITTYVWKAETDEKKPGYQPVDLWELEHSYPDPGDIGDSSDQSLWLKSITHTGKVGDDITLPPVTFTHTWKTNRVDKTDDIVPLNKPRLVQIKSETGALTTIDYSDEDCIAAKEGRRMPSAADDQSLRCYPVKWRPNGGDVTPITDWFHKYVVTGVRTTDPTGGSRPLVYHYDYAEGPAKHYTEDPLTKPNERTWSQWRGYGKVTTLVGENDELQRSKTVTFYALGMNGDRKLPSGTRTATVRGATARPIPDDNELAGFVRETVTHEGETGPELSGTVNDPWTKRTALRHYSWLDVEAHYVRTGATHTRSRLTSGPAPTERTRTVTTTYDNYGMPETVDDTGDTASGGDETCTRTWYARNADAGLTSLVSRTRKLAIACKNEDEAALPADHRTAGDVISDTATAYDTTTWTPNQTPTLGEPKWTGRVAGYHSDRSPTWQTVTTTTFDSLGRVVDVYNAKQERTSRTDYLPAGAGPLTQRVVTNAKDHTLTTVIDPAWGATSKIVDANKKVTEGAYDALGRLTKVYQPNLAHPNGESPNIVYDYHLSATKASWVSTSTFRGHSTAYNTSYQIFDALLRPRQIQTPSPLGGRLISETFYDSRGQTAKTYADIYDDKQEPSGQLYGTLNAQAPAETQYRYDGAGRVTTTTFLTYGTARWSTTSSYTGDSTATTAPAGGTATRQFTDVFDRVTERRTYPGTTPNGGTFLAIKFDHTPAGQVKKITGPDDTDWTYGYDLFGRKTYEKDPDKGETKTEYTVLDQVEWTQDANNKKLLYAYDALGRKEAMWAAARTDANLQASWTYDTLAKGQQDSATRYIGGKTGKAYTKKITEYDNLYRPKKTQLLLPADDPLVTAGVPAAMEFKTGYNLDGTIQYASQPAVAGLPRELVTFGYNPLGMPTTVDGHSGYVLGTAYTPHGDLQQLLLGTSETNRKQVTILNGYEPGTRRLKSSSVITTSHTYMLQDLHYDHDVAGNVTSIFDKATLGGTGKPDYQCITYGDYRRLAHAWTPRTPDCAASGRTVPHNDGAAPYWTSYTYKPSGLRDTETNYTAAGASKTTYHYGLAGDPAHALSKTETVPPGATTATSKHYDYDRAGNTTSRPGVHTTQTLTWNDEGKLHNLSEPATGTQAATNTGYLYDADGELLIRRTTTGNGETILYLGATEVRLTSGGTTKTLSGTRYYKHGVQTVAVRTGTKGVTDTKLHFLAGDHHQTASVAIDGTVVNDTPAPQTYSKRYTAPFGASRTPATAQTTPVLAWPDDKGFLGKPFDTRTGLTHIGARQYDPAIARFVSVDPLIDATDPQSLNGYTYANNNPATFSDSTGLCVTQDEYSGCASSSGGGGAGGDTGKAGSSETQENENHGNSGEDASTKRRPLSSHSSVMGRVVLWNPMLEMTQDEIDAKARKINALSWRDILLAFATGLGPRVMNFYQVDDMTMSIRSTAHMAEVRVRLAKMISKGGYKPDGNAKDWKYDLPEGVEGVARAAFDMVEMTRGLFDRVDDRAAGAALVGSYQLVPRVMAVDSRTGRAVVAFHASNVTDAKSGTRIPGTRKTPGGWTGPSSGPVSSIRQNFYWTEVITFD